MEKRTHAGYKACREDEAYSSGDELGIVGDGLLFKVEGRTSSGRMTPPVGTKRKAEHGQQLAADANAVGWVARKKKLPEVLELSNQRLLEHHMSFECCICRSLKKIQVVVQLWIKVAARSSCYPPLHSQVNHQI